MARATQVNDRADAYLAGDGDAVRERLERTSFGRLLPRLMSESGACGGVLDLGCADGMVAELLGDHAERYTGVDLRPRAQVTATRNFVSHDLRSGLGPVGREPFGLYVACFGVASHLTPAELERLLREIALHARPGAVVALEALGLFSLEWPRLWETEPGARRMLPYRLATEVWVHPWAPSELARLMERSGIEPLWALDRTIQAGPKLDEGRYWPGLPPVRRGLSELLEGSSRGIAGLVAALPPLPAHPAAAAHHALARRRRRIVRGSGARRPRDLARAVWALEPRGGAGLGHGLMVAGRVRSRG